MCIIQCDIYTTYLHIYSNIEVALIYTSTRVILNFFFLLYVYYIQRITWHMTLPTYRDIRVYIYTYKQQKNTILILHFDGFFLFFGVIVKSYVFFGNKINLCKYI
jgi:hypothetical protein